LQLGVRGSDTTDMMQDEDALIREGQDKIGALNRRLGIERIEIEYELPAGNDVDIDALAGGRLMNGQRSLRTGYRDCGKLSVVVAGFNGLGHVILSKCSIAGCIGLALIWR